MSLTQPQIIAYIAVFFAAAIAAVIHRAAFSVVVVAGFCLAYEPITGQPIHWPPAEAIERIAVGVVAVGVAALIVSLKRVPWWAGLVAAIVPGVFIGWTVWPHARKPVTHDQLIKAVEWTAGTAAVAAVLWSSTEAIAVRRPGSVATMWVVGLLTAGLMPLVLADGSSKFALMIGVLGVTAAGGLVAALFTNRPAFDRGPVLVFTAVLVMIGARAMIDADSLSPWRLAVVVASPLLAWVAEVIPFGKWHWAREAVRAVVIAVPIAVAVKPAVQNVFAELRGDSPQSTSEDAMWK